MRTGRIVTLKKHSYLDRTVLNSSSSKSWNLVADIGGTNARFARHKVVSKELVDIVEVSVDAFATLYSALDYYLELVTKNLDGMLFPSAACIAVACPANEETIGFTNNDWTIDKRHLTTRLKTARVSFINDFSAVGHAVPGLESTDWYQVGGGLPKPGFPIAVLGPGTGLGVCNLVSSEGRWLVIDGEGGHTDFAPIDKFEIQLLGALQIRFGRVSNERLLSGPGITNIYSAVTQVNGREELYNSPAEITMAASRDDDAFKTMEVFFSTLGSVAGNQALMIGAHGGVYIAGGIVPKLLPMVLASQVYERFISKGRFREYLNEIPFRVITRDHLGLFGCTRILGI